MGRKYCHVHICLELFPAPRPGVDLHRTDLTEHFEACECLGSCRTSVASDLRVAELTMVVRRLTHDALMRGQGDALTSRQICREFRSN